MQLHKAQVKILYVLRHQPVARFSELMRPTGMHGDVFKFHIRKLVQLGFITKNEDGAYILTDTGKEFANDLDDNRGERQQQPKLSVVVFVSRSNEKGELQFLVQQRRRQPFFGYWGTVGGPVRWGEQLEDAGASELLKQTGLVASCSVRGFYRKQDFSADRGEMLEDKIFAVLEAADAQGDVSNDWPWGLNKWMTLDEFKSQPKNFGSVCEMAAMLRSGKTYQSATATYAPLEY